MTVVRTEQGPIPAACLPPYPMAEDFLAFGMNCHNVFGKEKMDKHGAFIPKLGVLKQINGLSSFTALADVHEKEQRRQTICLLFTLPSDQVFAGPRINRSGRSANN